MGISMMAIANHNFRFEKPEACLRQLSERTGLPYAITPALKDDLTMDFNPPKNFFGWRAQPWEQDFDAEFREKGCFEARLCDSAEPYIGSHFFIAREPDESGRWVFVASALLKPGATSHDEYRESILQDFNALRFRLYRFVKMMGGDAALYFADSLENLTWEGFKRHYTLTDVLNVARRSYTVYRYPEDVALMETLDFSTHAYNLVVEDNFSDFKQKKVQFVADAE